MAIGFLINFADNTWFGMDTTVNMVYNIFAYTNQIKRCILPKQQIQTYV